MPGLKPLFIALISITTALTAALAFESVYDVSIRTRPPDPLVAQTSSTRAGAVGQPALPLRLVDSGGVGIPLGGDWGEDYSHDRRTFREAILEGPPYVDGAAFERIALEWRSHVERMLEYGNNAITVPLLLELIDFDRLPPPEGLRGAATVYGADSSFRARHAAVRRHFAPLFDWTARRGMQVFLDSDMLAVTPPLSRHLRNLAPDAGAVGIDTSDPAVWDVYRAGLEELFDEVPSISGLVIRFGEGGSLYTGGSWPYRSEMAVRDAASLRAMLRRLLPVFEARQKTLVLRSWTVGVGQIGRLHIDPRLYDMVLGDIDSPALIVSTKFTAGDFFSYLPLNPTLAGGHHRRLVELQAKSEFEGFGAFPNFLGEEHARALRALIATNPRIIGTYVLPQFGGPLRAGPRTRYGFDGFWLWTDANVFVASRLAIDPGADVGELARRWAAARFGDDPRIVDAVTGVLTQTREAVLEGFYIRSFAEREVRVPGLELPPLMWIFEWDMVGGWSSLLSIVYRSSRDAVDRAIQDGHAAAARVRRSRQQLQLAFAAADPGSCGRSCDQALRSLEYQETLFDVLAAWRQAFLSYYRWLDTGDAEAWRQWRSGRMQFDVAAARHMARFGNDLDFPAFDLTSAQRAVTAADRGAAARFIATTLLIGVVALVAIGSPLGRRWRVPTRAGALSRCGRLTWTAVVTPWRLGREPADVRAFATVAVLTLVLVGLVVGILTGFTTAWAGVGAPLLLGVVALAFEATAGDTGGREGRGRLLVASVGPLLPAVMALCAAIAYLGPVGFWYGFWISPIFRVAFLTLVLATLLWTTTLMFAAHGPNSRRRGLGGLIAAAGAGLVALTALLPDWVDVLRSLDRPLNIAPATETMLFALRAYAGVSLEAGGLPWAIGALLMAGGYAVCRSSRLRGVSQARPGPRVC